MKIDNGTALPLLFGYNSKETVPLFRMSCPEHQRLLGNEVNAWRAYKAIRDAPTTESNHETLDRLSSKAIVASNQLREHLQFCPVCKPLAK